MMIMNERSCISFCVVLLLSESSFAQQLSRLPEVNVSEAAPETLTEEQPIGPNEQPEWTTHRRFARTRVYVLPPWEAEVEQWWRARVFREGKPAHLLQTEIGVGLPYRLQLDLYENVERNPGSNWRHQGNAVELRYALADWGKIPLNPTLYGEWKFNKDEPDVYEMKLLLGEEIAPRWHWGFNAIFEREVSGSRETEIAASQAISYTLIDRTLSAGIEMQVERVSGPALNGKPEVEFLLGPSVQWRPIPRVHIDLVPLFGLTEDSPRVESFVIIGIDLGPSSNQPEVHAPASLKSR
jgi:hypothetical protein